MSLFVARSPAAWKAHWPSLPETTLTVGNFDGVHLGHQAILRQVVEQARQEGRLPTVVTFDPHPLSVLRPAEAPQLIETFSQRVRQLARMGIEGVLALNFTAEMARLSPQGFVGEILVGTMRARCVQVGEGFRFGHRQSGDVKLLEELGKSYGFQTKRVDPVRLRGRMVSSSAVREALRLGKMSAGWRMLGRPFVASGLIQRGTGTGRKLVVPTLNLATQQELLPAMGVYATETKVAAIKHRSVTNVGIRPTFGGTGITIESHLFDFCGEHTAGEMEVTFLMRLRDERKFSGAEELLTQIQRDVQKAREFFHRADRKEISLC
jgi:riboflavin kinase/FMN adenylyltransferase